MTTTLATGKRGRVQALQVELIHAVRCRGGKCNLALLETPAVVEAMVLMGTRHSLLHWIKLFSINFVVTDNIIGARPVIELVCRDVCDTSVCDSNASKNWVACASDGTTRGSESVFRVL